MPIVTGRPRSVADAAIFSAVADVVTAEGPVGLTLAAVARRAGLSAPALTQRFGSKRGLLLAFAASEADSVASVFTSQRAVRLGPLEAVRSGLVAFTGPVTSRKGMANNLAFLQLDLTDAELLSHAVAQSRRLRDVLVELLLQAIDAEELVDADPETLADDLYTVYCGAQLTWAIDGTGKLAAWMLERIDRTLAPYRVSLPTDASEPSRQSRPRAGRGRPTKGSTRTAPLR